jgi:hypothetical protein
MKKNYLIFAVAMLSLVMVSRSKNDDPAALSLVNPNTTSVALTLSIENGSALSSQIDSVTCDIVSDEMNNGLTVWKGPFKSSSLTLNLLVPPDNFLEKVTFAFSSDSDSYGSSSLTISDLTALTSNPDGMFVSAYKGQTEVG